MNLDQLGKSFQQHKAPILAAGAAGVVGLALLKRKQTGGGAGPGPASSGGVSVSGGGQLAGANGAPYYDSSASDVYGLVQPQLESLGNQITDLGSKLNAVPVSSAPPSRPISSTLFAPKLTGRYVYYTNGAYGEVEDDGSVYGISTAEATPEQWKTIFASAQGIGSTQTAYSDRMTNLAAVVQKQQPPSK